MSFKEIFCQDSAIDILQRAFNSGRTSHAYIFAGQEGIGKFLTASNWAKLLLCHNPIIDNGFAQSCDSCQSCNLFGAGTHPDFIHVYKELREFTEEGKGKAAPVDMSIDVIREMLNAKVSIRPSLSKRKVFVVSEAEKMNASSQNCMLKVLEEPPLYCCIILLCTRLEKLLPTTKSRAHIIRFGPIEEKRIIDKLREKGLDENMSKYFARLSQGSLGQACNWAELELNEANIFKSRKEIINSLSQYSYSDALELADTILSWKGKIAAIWSNIDKTTSKTDISRRVDKLFIQIIISFLYDVMKINIKPESQTINFDQLEQVEKLAFRLNSETAAEKISDCFTMLQWIDANVNERLIFEHLLLSLADCDTIQV
jgi:DNA polymerase-3 subunit delta'